MSDISQAIHKVDASDKLAGKALYIQDIRMSGMLYGKTLRSNCVHGHIETVIVPELPEGYYYVDASDILGDNVVNMIYDDMPIFAKDTIYYDGEPIGLFVGPDKAQLDELIKMTKIQVSPLKPYYGYTHSVIHQGYTKGEGDKYFEDCDAIIEGIYQTGYQEQLYIEPQGLLGFLDESGKLVIQGSMQCPYYIKKALMRGLNLKDDAVRVIQNTTGGAFGGKEEFPSLLACQIGVAVLKTKQPVQIIYSRHEDIRVTTKRHPSEIKLEAAIKNNEIVGLRAHVSLDAGAYIGLSGVVLQRAMLAASGAYVFEHMLVSGDVYQTCTVPTGAFRGFGAPQMIFAIEMFIQEIARKTGQNEVVMRKKYLAKQGDMTSTSGHFRDVSIMPQMIERAISLSDYETKWQRYEHEQSFKGIGMSWFLHGCGFTGSGEQKHIKAIVKLQKDEVEDLHIRVAAVDMGQGIQTTLRKLVAHRMDYPINRVHYENPDTDKVPDSGPTVASRTMMIVGGLMAEAVDKMKAQWQVGVMETTAQYVQPEFVHWDDEKLKGDAYPSYSWGVNVIEVEVSPITYEVTLKNCYAVYDVGHAIDESVIIGQAEGGLLQGIAYGMLEQMTLKEGIIQQSTVTDYLIPTAADTIDMVTQLMDNPYELGPYGAKGAGELTLIGGAPAIAMAISQAIKRPIRQIPVTPERIKEVLEDGSH